MSQKHQGTKTTTAGRKPKKKCCVSRPKCSRCPLRMLADGTLPDGYTVKKRKLVPVDGGKTSHKGKAKDKKPRKGKAKDKKSRKGKAKGTKAA